jgi:histidyl-tRNA synthetase
LDKFQRFGLDGVTKLLGVGRKDDSGDFTKGAELRPEQVDTVVSYLTVPGSNGAEKLTRLGELISKRGGNDQAANDTAALMSIVWEAGFKADRVEYDPSVVRGLEYYTGPVFECELLMETKDEDGRPVRFGSVGGGGRYDDLVARFTGQQVPATGFSIGVSRLYAALQLVGKAEEATTLAPVIVTVMDRNRIGDYQKYVTDLRNAGIRAEMYLGTSGMKAQMKYADKRGSPLVVIQGGDEKAKGEVQLKDLRLGAELAKGIQSREDYASQRLAQFSVPEGELVAAVTKALAGDSKNP